MKYLLDLNVALAILHAGHEHTEVANRWLAMIRGTAEIGLCRVVQLGMLRLLTQPRVMQDSVLTPSQAWVYLDLFISDDRIGFLEEPQDFVDEWRAVCQSLPVGASAETDAYLASLASSRDLTIVTFDRGFEKFSRAKTKFLTRG